MTPRPRERGSKRRAPRRPRARAAATTVDPIAGDRTDAAVEELLRTSDHPLVREMRRVRQILLGASPEVREEVKWNAPSFRTDEHFATLQSPASPRGRDRVTVIFHTGARAKGVTMKGRVPDPDELLRWLAPDRAMAQFEDTAAIERGERALAELARAWIRALGGSR